MQLEIPSFLLYALLHVIKVTRSISSSLTSYNVFMSVMSSAMGSASELPQPALFSTPFSCIFPQWIQTVSENNPL